MKTTKRLATLSDDQLEAANGGRGDGVERYHDILQTSSGGKDPWSGLSDLEPVELLEYEYQSIVN